MKRAGAQSLSPDAAGGNPKSKKGKSGKMFKRSGNIVFLIPKFKEFSESGQAEVRSDGVEYINGLPYYLLVQNRDDKIDISLVCEVDAEIDENVWITYDALGTTLYPASLIDSDGGLYNEEEDLMTFVAQINADEVIGPSGVEPNAVLLVNQSAVYVNNELLAACSTFFESLFFGENAEEVPKIQIDDVPDPVENFGRLLATMGPPNVQLNDECVENVWLLAKRFSIGSVEKRCVEFLFKESKKSAICKFRLAPLDKKEQILNAMTEKDFSISLEDGYSDNLYEIRKLNDQEIELLRKRQKEICETGLIDAAEAYGGNI
uniref:BTB domain-containing protein n=1 Tax=Globodera rostochiensis TaxID=31243 RepID=A0A914HJK1_GLORO